MSHQKRKIQLQRQRDENKLSAQVISFFFLAFLITWACHIPQVAFVKGWLPFRPPLWLLLAGVSGPLIAAIFLTLQYEGANGVKRLLGKFLIWKISWYWYVLALFTAVAVRFGGLEILKFFEGSIPDITYMTPAAILLALPQWIFIVPIEEIGWRGYALPRLQAKFSALGAGSILGGDVGIMACAADADSAVAIAWRFFKRRNCAFSAICFYHLTVYDLVV